MTRFRTLLGIGALLLVLVACDTASAGGGGGDGNGNGNGNGQPDPTDIKPSAIEVLAMSDEFTFEFMPDAPLAELEWDVEIEYETGDVDAVFDFYDAALVAEGFTRTGIERGDDEVEADYADGEGLVVELEVELDDGWVQVDMDTDDFEGPFPTGFTLTEFAGFETPIYGGAEVRDVEWDFSFDHPSTGVEEVFAYYDGHLLDLGWERTEIDDDDDDEREAEYVRDGVFLELEVDDEGEVEIEVNKLRFYGN